MPKDHIDVVPFRSGRISITFTPEQLTKIEHLANQRRRRAWEWVRMVVLDAIDAEVTETASEVAKRKLLVEQILAELRGGVVSRVEIPDEPVNVVWNGKRSGVAREQPATIMAASTPPAPSAE